MMEEISLPDEVLIQIISYLKVADVLSCRLVCRRWRSYCEDKVITRAEKFVFHSATHFTSEIDKFLINLERSRVNIQLDEINLKELNFKAFGEKIEELKMINCLVDEITLKNLFYLTPNMTCLQVRLGTFGYPVLQIGEPNFDVWKACMDTLHEEKFQHPNLKDFNCNLYEFEKLKRQAFLRGEPTAKFNLGDKFLAHVFFVFPCLQNIHFNDDRWSCDNLIMKNMLPKTSLTNFGGIFEINFDREDQLETFASLFPRLKSLNLAIKISAWRSSSLKLCERFFSVLTELELLNLNCEIEERSDDGAVKALLFQTLKSCAKLRKFGLRLIPSTKTEIRLNRDELQEFSSLITKIKKLRIPEMAVELECNEAMLTLPHTNGLLEYLRFASKYSRPFDMYQLIMNTYQLTILCVHLEADSSTMTFEKILQSQKCLQRLTFTTHTKLSEATFLQIKSNEVLQLKHERLEHLQYVFWPGEENYPIDYFVKRLCLWEFPNLRSLLVTSFAELNAADLRLSQVVKPELENIFKEWIGKMKTLTHVNVHMYRGLLDLQEFLQVCENLPRLQSIIWTGRETNMPQKEDFINLFQNHQNLKELSYPKQDVVYKYSRSKRRLFLVSPNRIMRSLDLIFAN